MQKSCCFLSVSSILISMGLASQAFAAGFQVNELSSTIQGTALADAATAAGDVTGQAYNPALLATVQGTQIYVGGSVIIPHITFNNARGQISYNPDVVLNSASLPSSNVNIPVNGAVYGSNIAPTVAVPALYVSTPLSFISPALKAGIGINSQWGLGIDYPDNWAGMYSSTSSSIKTIDITPALAYQVNPWLSVGAGLNVQYMSANLAGDSMTVENLGAPSTGTPTNVTLINYNSLSGNSWAAGYTLGLLITPRPGTNIGLDYRSQVKQNLKGNISGAILSAGLYPNYMTPLDLPITGTGSTTITLPAVINLGISQQINNRLTLMAGVQYTNWSSLNNLNINANTTFDIGNGPESQAINQNYQLNWTHSWLYSLGGSYILNPKWTLLGGLAYDETPTNNTDRDSRIPDTNREWVSAGAEYAATNSMTFNATYTHIFMNNQSINSVETPVAGQPTYVTTANYKGYADIVAAGMNYTF